jgi:ATP-binding cassette, subfamily C, bacterial exporter for protease/lipase
MMHPVLGWTGWFLCCFFGALAYLSSRWTEAPFEKAMEASQVANTYVGTKLKNSEIVESLGMLSNLRSTLAQLVP